MESSSCQWKPHELNDGLYALWLSTTDVDGFTNWTVSPPWKAKINQQQEEPVASRLAPYIAPISALLLIYALCLGLYWIVKKRRAKRRAAEATEKAARARRTKQFKQRGRYASTTAQPSIRSPSVNTVTYDILEENNPQKKDEIFIYSAAGANMRRGSDDVIDSPLSDATLIEEHEQALANAAVRFYR
ncbi:hypothetical protein VHEMI06549 [[Torrubiella] hemipterigena]|nr:hypothetical protein VHEMI06549 [[Torrubiella] hemipterigena]